MQEVIWDTNRGTKWKIDPNTKHKNRYKVSELVKTFCSKGHEWRNRFVVRGEFKECISHAKQKSGFCSHV